MTKKRYKYIPAEGFNDYGAYISPYVVEALLNKLSEENEQLKEDNRRLQFRTVDMLDYIKRKGAVTHQEMKE